MLKRFFAVIVMCGLSLAIILTTRQYKREKLVEQQQQSVKEEEPEDVKSFDIWYNYNGYEPYLKYVAEEFKKETGITVNLQCISDLGYATIINEKSIKGNGPDLYISSIVDLENLYLSGVVSVVADDSLVNEDNYAKKAIQAVKYGEKVCGYPLGYEVSVLAYNSNYIKEEPATFEDIMSYVGYDEEGETDFSGISKILDMESDKMLYNYGFFAEYLRVDKDLENEKLNVSLNSEEAKSAAVKYVALKEYFGLSNESRAYTTIVNDFAAGKSLFAILNTQIVGNEAFASISYGVMPVPDFTADLKVTPMSYTEILVVNPYTDDMENALKFAKMMSYDYADVMYEKCQILSTKRGIEYKDPIANEFFEAYEESTYLPKYMETEDYSLLVKNAINHIWKGETIVTVLDQLQQTFETKNE